MITFKDDVPKDVLSGQVWAALVQIDMALKGLLGPEYNLVVTSTSDGRHMRTSKHYETPCQAADIRIWNILEMIVARMTEIVGDDFDVVLEKDHIHLEWDPEEL